MRASTLLALSAGLLGESVPDLLGVHARPVSERDKAKLDPRHVAEAKSKAEAKRERKAKLRRPG